MTASSSGFCTDRYQFSENHPRLRGERTGKACSVPQATAGSLLVQGKWVSTGQGTCKTALAGAVSSWKTQLSRILIARMGAYRGWGFGSTPHSLCFSFLPETQMTQSSLGSWELSLGAQIDLKPGTKVLSDVNTYRNTGDDAHIHPGTPEVILRAL